jgi:hypothetical protein
MRIIAMRARHGDVALQRNVASPGEVEIRAALDRIVASPGFRVSPQLVSFLRFVVEATLSGQADRIKGYSIAVGALGRNDTFDPQTNPIVRVEAGRLRRALAGYYAGPGRDDEVVIALPRGRSIPTFGHRGIIRGLRALAAGGRRLIPRAVRRRVRLVVLVAGVSACVSLMLDIALIMAQRAVGQSACQQTGTSELDRDWRRPLAPTQPRDKT